MIRLSQATPLLIGLALAALAALGARMFLTAGIPEQVVVAVADVPLQPGEVFSSKMARTLTAYASPALRAAVREDELPQLEGGRILMFVPAGALIPRTAIVPPGEDDAPGRLFAVAARGEHLMILQPSERVIAPPLSRLRPGDCMDVVAFFGEQALTGPVLAPEISVPEDSAPVPGLRPTPTPPSRIPAPEIAATTPITGPERPMAKHIARVVVRSVLDLPLPVRESGATAPAVGAASPRLLVAVPPAAVEGLVYAMGAAETVHLVLVPPCERPEIPPSSAFSEIDLRDWVRTGRQTAGPPTFFLGVTPTPTPGITPTPTPEP